MGTLAMKFGGTSVGTAAALARVARIVVQEQKHWDRLIIVVAALGGVTDALVAVTQSARTGDHSSYRRRVAAIRERHLELIEQLPFGADERATLQANIDRLLFDVLEVCQSVPAGKKLAPAALDKVVGVGEQLSARIIAMLLRHHQLRAVAIDATEIIITQNGPDRLDKEETRARIKDYLTPMLDQDIIPVVTGFVAGTRSGAMSTLGRGGSDYTASILSVYAGANQLWMWTDVDGIMTADPRRIPSAKVIPQLTYEEAAELAYFGARILHPHMIHPLSEQHIALHVKSIFKPEKPGTRVGRTKGRGAAKIKAVTSIQGLGLAMGQRDTLVEVVTQINDLLSQLIGSPAEAMVTAQSSARSWVGFAISTSVGQDADATIHAALVERLQANPDLSGWQIMPVSFITAVGAGLDRAPQLLARIFEALDGLPVLAVSRGPGGGALSAVVATQDEDEALARIHRLTVA